MKKAFKITRYEYVPDEFIGVVIADDETSARWKAKVTHLISPDYDYDFTELEILDNDSTVFKA